MTQPLKLYLPLTVFERLHKAADGRGKKTSVSKADLAALLMDHSRILSVLQDEGIPVEDNYADSSYVRQARGR